jgi:hypothetical protein
MVLPHSLCKIIRKYLQLRRQKKGRCLYLNEKYKKGRAELTRWKFKDFFPKIADS